jgi:arylsulfatase
VYGLTKSEVTVAQLLSDSGYATAMYGKWHLGQTEGRFPTDRGFDEWYGIPNSTDESSWANQPITGDGRPHPFVKPEYIMEARKGETPREVKIYDREQRALIDGELTRRAIDFIGRQAKSRKPFFLFLPYTSVHFPVLPSPEFKGKTGNGEFADVLAQMDAYMGRLLDGIDKAGVRDNTIVIFTSDNGSEALAPYQGTSGPWRGTYFTGLEGSLRVPFIARWPGHIPQGLVSNEIVHEMDILPTVLSWTGISLPKDRTIDGVDQGNFLQGKQAKSNREGFVVYVGNDIYGVKWRNWKMMSKEVSRGFGEPVRQYGIALMYNLLTDPKEEYPLDPRMADSLWVRYPASQILIEHIESLKKEPPIRPGAPD